MDNCIPEIYREVIESMLTHAADPEQRAQIADDYLPTLETLQELYPC